ncbi:MAG: serine hydrolase [Bacteroidota bacterium]
MKKTTLMARVAMLVGVALVFLLAACQPEPPTPLTVADPAALDAMIDTYVADGSFPVLYARLEDKSGRVIYEHGAINEELIPGMPIDGQTWFRIWSMSKIITISVTLDLVEEGLLSLDDPVTQHIPEFEGLEVAVSADGEDLATVEDKEAACPLQMALVTEVMTVRHLINHQAGFYYATTGIPCLDEPLAASNVVQAENSQAFVDALARLPLVQQPGNPYFYGTNTTVLGIVAERATGKSLKQLVRERVTDPLQIDALQYGLPTGVELLPRISGQGGTLRTANPGELDIFGPDVPDYDPAHELYLGGEGMLATTDGYADFLRMLLNRGELNGHRFLEETTIEEITSPHTLLDNDYGYNGYNLWVNSGTLGDGSQGVGGLWIGGGYEGTHFWIDPEREFVGLIMSQIFSAPASGWGRDDKLREAIYAQLSGD